MVVRAPGLWFNVAMPQPPRRRPHRQRPETRSEVSAGGVIYRRTPEGIVFGLIATKGRTRWQLPKGKQEKGESLEATAAREVAEETGLVGTVQAPLDSIDIWFSVNDGGRAIRRHKLVHFYLLEYQSGTTDAHDDEVLVVAVPVGQLRQRSGIRVIDDVDRCRADAGQLVRDIDMLPVQASGGRDDPRCLDVAGGGDADAQQRTFRSIDQFGEQLAHEDDEVSGDGTLAFDSVAGDNLAVEVDQRADEFVVR